MKTNHRLGLQIKCLREIKGLTQAELGKAIGLSQQAIVGIETGRRETTVTKLVSIADFFDVTLDLLVGRIHSSTTDPKILSVDQYNLQDISKAAMHTAKALRALAKKINEVSDDGYEYK